MTRVAWQGRGNMSGALAGGYRTVMATLTRIRGLAVVNRGQRIPVGRPVASIAHIGRQRMGTRFRCRDGAIVTTLATVRGLAVVNRCQRNPVVTGMAGITHIGGHRMGRRFKRGSTHPVMATRLGAGLTHHLTVVE